MTKCTNCGFTWDKLHSNGAHSCQEIKDARLAELEKELLLCKQVRKEQGEHQQRLMDRGHELEAENERLRMEHGFMKLFLQRQHAGIPCPDSAGSILKMLEKAGKKSKHCKTCKGYGWISEYHNQVNDCPDCDGEKANE